MKPKSNNTNDNLPEFEYFEMRNHEEADEELTVFGTEMDASNEEDDVVQFMKIKRTQWSDNDNNSLLELTKYKNNANDKRGIKYFRAIHAEFNEKADYKNRTVPAMRAHYLDLIKNIKKSHQKEMEYENYDDASYSKPWKQVIEEQKHKVENMLRKWLVEKVELPQYFDVFIEKGYDDVDMIENTLTDQDLIEIGIEKIGHRKKILWDIEQIKRSK